jgi:hypothetical protein
LFSASFDNHAPTAAPTATSIIAPRSRYSTDANGKALCPWRKRVGNPLLAEPSCVRPRFSSQSGFLIPFPDRASLDAFVADPDYAPYAKARQDGSVSRFHVIDDTDLAGAIPYLPKG